MWSDLVDFLMKNPNEAVNKFISNDVSALSSARILVECKIFLLPQRVHVHTTLGSN